MLAVGLLAGCFSDDPEEMTGPLTGGCQVDLASPIIGSVGVIVAMRDFEFFPQEVHVPRGTRVTWVNCEDANIDAHTTTSDASVWQSPLMTTGGEFSHVFDESGRFPYHCVPHAAFMRGVVIVE
jgi:plastocyanin